MPPCHGPDRLLVTLNLKGNFFHYLDLTKAPVRVDSESHYFATTLLRVDRSRDTPYTAVGENRHLGVASPLALSRLPSWRHVLSVKPPESVARSKLASIGSSCSVAGAPDTGRYASRWWRVRVKRAPNCQT